MSSTFLIFLAPLGFFALILSIRYLSRRQKKIRAFAKRSPQRSAPLQELLRQRTAASTAAGAMTTASADTAPSALGPAPESTPGRQLPYRLEQEESEKAGAIGLFIFGIIWTGVSTWAFFQADDAFFLGLFILIGVAVLAGAVRQALVAWGTGKTVLEISRAELLPGESFQALIEQHGHMHVNALEARLLCREKAVYRQGTDTRTATEDVVDLPLDKAENIRVTGQLARHFEGRIPESAMHSFKGGNNSIEWRIVVTGDIDRWPDFKRGFRLRVLADDGGGQ